MRILVVEDDATIASALKSGLTQESFAVDVAYDGQEGYQTLLYGDYDLAILDIMLPGMSGTDMARALHEANVTTRLLMLSAKDTTADKITGLNRGADDYMTKPFSFEELLARVQALLRRPHEATGEMLKAANLTLNTISKEVTCDDRKLVLSAKEYALLEYLLRNKGRVVSKTMILSHVWDFDATILPHTIEVYMATLRAKIDKPFKRPPIIQTVRGFGYTIGDL
jgi:DNA-binding response OmpR family regulator